MPAAFHACLCLQALKEMNGKYIGNRPARLRKSNWAERNADVPQNKKFVKKG